MKIYIYLILILISAFLVIMQIKRKPTKLKQKLKYKKMFKSNNKTLIKNYKYLSNFFIMINKKRVYNFLPFYSEFGGGLKIINNYYNIIIKSKFNLQKIYVKNNDSAKHEITLVYVLKSADYKVYNKGIKLDQNYFISNEKINVINRSFKTKLIKNLIILPNQFKCYEIKNNLFNFITMQNKEKSFNKGNINKKNVVVDLFNCIARVKAKNCDINCLLNCVIKSKKPYKGGLILNNEFLLKNKDDYYYIYKLGTSNLNENFNSKTNDYFGIKIKTKNKFINELFNVKLPCLILSEFCNNYQFANFETYLSHEEKLKYSILNSINQLLKQNKFVETYNFILKQIVGITCLKNDALFLTRPKISFGKIGLKIFNENLIISYENNKLLISYNNITYENIGYLKLNKVKHKPIEKNA